MQLRLPGPQGVEVTGNALLGVGELLGQRRRRGGAGGSGLFGGSGGGFQRGALGGFRFACRFQLGAAAAVGTRFPQGLPVLALGRLQGGGLLGKGCFQQDDR